MSADIDSDQLGFVTMSARSQGVPAVAIGWSHKYTNVLGDYRVPWGVLSLDYTHQAESIIFRNRSTGLK
jgi:hypothetical protein